MEKDRIYSFNSKIYDVFQGAISKKVFPGAAYGISVGRPEERITLCETPGFCDYEGKKKVSPETFYDLASLSKPLATVLSLLCLCKDGKVKATDRLVDFFPAPADPEKGKITIGQLLSHASGLPAHREYYRILLSLPRQERKERLLALLMEEPLVCEPGTRSLYSDLGFMLLGLLVEKLSGESLENFYRKKVLTPLGLAMSIRFGPLPEGGGGEMSIAPGEYCQVRKKVLVGEVGDENAFALGGVAGHAGLFGTITGVQALVLHLLDQWQGREEHPNYLGSDLRFFLRRAAVPESTWALGFDTPSAVSSSAGSHLSPFSIGHLGYSGTSFWIDPARELAMVLLSNRVHPRRDNEQIKQFRPLFHNLVVESLGLA